MNTTIINNDKLAQIAELGEQFNAELDDLKAFSYIYETLTAFNVTPNHKELAGIVHSTAQIERVYLTHLEKSYGKLLDQIIKLQQGKGA